MHFAVMAKTGNQDEIGKSIGKGVIAQLLADIVTCLVEVPGCLREVPVKFTQLSYEAPEHRVQLLDTLITKVEVVIRGAGPRLRLAVVFNVIDDCQTNNFSWCLESV